MPHGFNTNKLKPYKGVTGGVRLSDIKQRTSYVDRVTKEGTEVITPIQGKQPDSVQEWRLGIALMQLEVDFLFQVEINLGRSIRGGMILDYLCFVPFPVPVPVEGEYWHRVQISDYEIIKFEILKMLYGQDPVPFYEHELTSVDRARLAIQEKLL